MLKLKMMLCVMMLPMVVVGCTSKQSVSQCVKPPPPPAWIMQPPDWRTPAGLFHPQREADHYARATGKEPRSILMSSADRVAHIDGQLVQYCEQYTRACFRYKCTSNKTEQSIYECLLGFCFNNIFCAATNFGCIDIFFCPIPETKK